MNVEIKIEMRVVFRRCLEFMSDYINCLLQGYGVLPGPPSKVHVTDIAPYFAILHWSSPATLGDTVQYYNVYYRKITTEDSTYTIIKKVRIAVNKN